MLDLILCGIAVLAIATVYIGSIIKNKPFTNKACRYYLVLVAVHALYILNGRYNFGPARFVNAGAPFGLLYGPLFFMAFNSMNGKKIKNIFLHFVPAAIFTIGFVIFLLDPGIKSAYLIPFYILLFSGMILSLLGYAIFSMFRNIKQDMKNEAAKKMLKAWSFCLIMIALLLLSILFTRIIPERKIIVELPAILIYGLIFTTVCLIFRYTITQFVYESSARPATAVLDSPQPVKYVKSSVKNEDFANYKKKLDVLFQKEQIYLQNELTLDILSKKLKISRHYLTQLFNVHIGENFNSYVNRHRIEYAIQLANSATEKISIEDLAFNSGFNSKVSFNRHFKNSTGYSPSEYIALPIAKKTVSA